MKSCLGVMTALAVALSSTNISFADDERAEELLARAKELYSQRDRADKDQKTINEAIKVLAEAETEAEDEDLKYDILILASRAYYFAGQHVPGMVKETVMALHDKGMAKARQAFELSDAYAEGHYFYAINLARWAKAKGILASLDRKDELIKASETAIQRFTRDEKKGETTDSFGPFRTLGRMYAELPGAVGGDDKKALMYLEKAYGESEKAKNQVGLNIVYYAEVLYATKKEENKKRARELLDRFIATKPETFNADRVPETLDDQELAIKVRKEMN